MLQRPNDGFILKLFIALPFLAMITPLMMAFWIKKGAPLLDLWPFMMPVAAAVVLSAFLVTSILRRRKLYDWLDMNGTTIQATDPTVKTESYKGQVTYSIWCQWVKPETNVAYTFMCRGLRNDPTNALPKTIPVVVDYEQPKRYAVDAGALNLQ